MKVSITIIFVLFSFQCASAQITKLTLNQCQKDAISNYPLLKGKDLMTEASKLKMENLKTAFLPDFNLGAKATYQSDIPEIDFSIPNLPSVNIPKAPKDQYSVNVDVSQLIYDGGRLKVQKQIEESNLAADIQSVEVELYQLKTRINTLYFTILTIQENISLLEVKKQELSERIKSVISAVENGAMLKSNEFHLKAELLSLQQKIIELKSAKISAIEILSELSGKEISIDSQFELPDVVLKNGNEYLRPEYLLFDLKNEQIEAGKLFMKKQRMPVIGGFGQFGYGNPGLNMLNNEFDTYFIVGAKLSWNMYDWKKNQRKQKTFDIQKDILETKRKTFSLNINTQLKSELAAIRKFEEMVKLDDEIIQYRSEITKGASSQLNEGVITSADFIKFLNEEIQARINMEYHKIQAIRAKINYNNISGD
ncbi:TolC family protein [Bacteroidota bacterium]